MEGIKKEHLKRRVFKLEFKAKAVQHQKAENLTPADCARKLDLLPKLIQHWEKQYDADQLTVVAGRRAVTIVNVSPVDCLPGPRRHPIRVPLMVAASTVNACARTRAVWHGFATDTNSYVWFLAKSLM